jgi:hypothetical protein
MVKKKKNTTACQDAMEANLKKFEPNPGEEAVMEQQEISNENAAIHSLRACRSETAAFQEATEGDTEKTEPDPGIMQSVREHQEVTKEDAAVMPVGGLRKRRRDRNLAAGRRQKPKRSIPASCESRRRSTVAGRKMTRRATVELCSENVVRKDWNRNQAKRGTSKRNGEGLWKGQECNNSIRNPELR